MALLILLAVAILIPYLLFKTVQSDVRKVTGTNVSLYTSALLYRKLKDENELTRLQIRLTQDAIRNENQRAAAERFRPEVHFFTRR